LPSLYQDRSIFGQAVCNSWPGVSQVATIHPDKIINVFIYAGLGHRGGAYVDVKICVTRGLRDQARLPLAKLKPIPALNPQLRRRIARQDRQRNQKATNPREP